MENEKINEIIRAELKKNGISEKSYANMFAKVFEGQLCFEKDAWLQDGNKLSELKVLDFVSTLCEAVREVIREEFKSTFIIKLISADALQGITNSLFDIESLKAASAILDTAKPLMKKGKGDTEPAPQEE